MRLSQYIAKKYNISRREAKEEILKGFVLVNSQITKKDIEITESQNIEYSNSNTFSSIDSDATKCIDINDFNKYLIYNDSNYLFLYKPYFMHSDRHRQNDPLTISDIITYYKNYVSLTRLDYETDGIIGAVSKDLFNQVDKLKISKKYLAITYGLFPKNITISKKIDAAKTKKVKVIEDDNSGFQTYISLIDSKTVNYKNNKIEISLIEVDLEKAARHQIRAFTSYLNHPIIFDEVYGNKDMDNLLLDYISNNNKSNIIPKRLMLHCFNYNIDDKNIFCNNETKIFKDYFYNL